MTNNHAASGAANAVSDHDPKDLQPLALVREMHRSVDDYGFDRIAGVPIARIPRGLFDRIEIALRRLAGREGELTSRMQCEVCLGDTPHIKAHCAACNGTGFTERP